MITMHQAIDVAARTVTWSVEETPPEHDVDGVMCHAVDEAVHTQEFRHILTQLGYRLVAAKVDALTWFAPAITYYWAPPS